MVGCGATRPATAPKLDQPVSSAGRVHDLALRDARAESDGLRSAVAAARIAAAKQEAELQDLRRQVGDLQQALLIKQRDIATLRQERDGLLQAKAEMHAQVVDLVDARPIVGQAKTVETPAMSRLSQLESAVQRLTSSLEKMKQDLTRLQARGVTKAKPMVLAEPSTGRP